MEELTSKKRAELRSLATNLDPVVLIGKGCLSPEILSSIEEAFHTRELLKVAVLNNADVNIKEVAVSIAEELKCQVVAVTGHKIILFKINQKLRQEAAEKAKRVKKHEQAAKLKARTAKNEKQTKKVTNNAGYRKEYSGKHR